jgi:hypothetical protein
MQDFIHILSVPWTFLFFIGSKGSSLVADD